MTVLVAGAHPTCGEEKAPEPPPTVADLARKWQGDFGAVPFSDENLFDRMVLLHPQPETAFTAFGDARLSTQLRVLQGMWAELIFRGALLERISESPPTGYYLNGGRTESSLLLYQATIDGDQVSLQESSSAYMLSVKPALPRAESGLSAADVERILGQLTRFDEKPSPSFSPQDGMHTGQVFANNQGRDILRIQDWREDVVGFVAEDQICFIVIKVDAELPRVSFDLIYDFNWLDGQIERPSSR